MYPEHLTAHSQDTPELTEQVIVGILLILPCEFAVADVVQVLQPLKIGDSDTTSIGIQVRDHQHLSIMQNLLSRYGGGAIRTLSNHL